LASSEIDRYGKLHITETVKKSTKVSTVNVALFWPDGKRELMWSPIDVRGNFLLEGIPAGSYWLELRAYSPEFQRMVRARKQVQVADGAAIEVLLTLI